MKKMLYIFILFFLSTAVFCQDPPDFGDPNDPNPTDATLLTHDQVPIMVIAAIFFGICVIAGKKYNPLKRFTN
jgi:hypothetical protein